MGDWVVETPSFEEQLMNNRIVYLNQNGINNVVEIIKNKDKEIERLNNVIKTKDEGIKALTEDLCDTTKELEEAYERIKGLEVASSKLDYEATIYTNRIDKAIEFIENDNTIVGKDINGELYAYELKILDILKGV